MLLFKEINTLNATRRSNKDTLDKLEQMGETIGYRRKKNKR
jgi:hypothetical protein